MMRKISKEEKEKRSLVKVMRDSYRNQIAYKRLTKRETFENQMKLNKENLSPNGGRKPFNITTNDKKDN